MRIRTIALVAHDNCKRDLIEWVRFNRGTLEKYRLVCTGTTGRLVQEALEEDGQKDLNITRLKSGPLGGDQQLGALIAEEVIDMMLRISNLYNVPTAYNRSTADFLISSPLFKEDYDRKIRDYSGYLNRELKEATSQN